MMPDFSFSINGSEIILHTYSFIGALSIGIGLLVTYLTLRGVALSPLHSSFVCFFTGVSFLVGARVLNFYLNYEKYHSLGLSIGVWKFGYFSLYGGILLAALVFALLCRYWGVPLFPVLDQLTPVFLACFALMKIGCFLNGCCSGNITQSFLSVPLPAAEKAQWVRNDFVAGLLQPETMRVYPTQLMEGFAALLIIVGLRPWRTTQIHGFRFFTAVFFFSFSRLVILRFRSTGYSMFVTQWFYPVLYAAIMASVGYVILKKCRIKVSL